MRLGMFDPPARVPWAAIPYERNDCDEHHALARTAARESIVLLKNEGGLLPLKKDVGSIAVIGPNAYDPHVLVANYFGIPSRAVTPLDGIRAAVSPATKVLYTDGCKLQGTKTDGLGRAGNLSEAVSVAARADVVVLCLGLSADIEGEQGDAGNSEAAGDKIDLKLPGLQQRLLEMIVALGKPTVLCVLAGSALDLTWAQDHVAGDRLRLVPRRRGRQRAGRRAVRRRVAGGAAADHVPAFDGRRPLLRQLRDEGADLPLRREDAAVSVRLRPVVHDVRVLATSRCRARASAPATPSPCQRPWRTSASVRGDEVVQLYLKDLEASCAVPLHDLRGFARIRLGPGEAHDDQLRPRPRAIWRWSTTPASASSSPAASARRSAAASPTRAAPS